MPLAGGAEAICWVPSNSATRIARRGSRACTALISLQGARPALDQLIDLLGELDLLLVLANLEHLLGQEQGHGATALMSRNDAQFARGG